MSGFLDRGSLSLKIAPRFDKRPCPEPKPGDQLRKFERILTRKNTYILHGTLGALFHTCL
jgi:hypothetical protein